MSNSKLVECIIVWGELAAKKYDEGETNRRALNLLGSVSFYSFKNTAEKDAFLMGVNEALEENGFVEAAPNSIEGQGV